MSNSSESRIESLEIKLMHQESTIEELTRTLLSLEDIVTKQTDAMKRLQTQLRSLTPSHIATHDDETPPPHY